MGDKQSKRDGKTEIEPASPPPPKPGELVEGRDYVIDANGNLVFTAEYHLRRGDCCGNGCVNCPY